MNFQNILLGQPEAGIYLLTVNRPKALALESGLFGRCCATLDQKEGMRAFLAKRRARFTGK